MRLLERIRYARRIRRDPLTGLPILLASPKAAPAPATVIGIDVREMPRINYAHGHRVGDEILAELGRRLKAAARPWPAYRTGRDEFVVVARVTDESEIRSLADRLREPVMAPYALGIAIEVSLAAVSTGDGETLHDAFRSLNAALASRGAR